MMSTPHMAKRAHSVCEGSLWRNQTTGSAFPSASQSRSYEYCVLVGTKLSAFETLAAYERGEYPICTFEVVGASTAITKPKSLFSKSNGVKGSADSSFRLVTNQGTQIFCTAPTTSCREQWLSAFYAGLDRRLSETIAEPVSPLKRSLSRSNSGDSDSSGGAILTKLRPSAKFRVNAKDKFCASCAKLERLEFPILLEVAPLSQYGIETRADMCHRCAMAQGVVDHTFQIKEMWASAKYEEQILLKARALCWRALRNNDGGDASEDVNDFEPMEGWVPTPETQEALKKALESQEFLSYQKVSPILDTMCQRFQQDLITLVELMEQLDHAVGKRDMSLSMLKKQAFRVAGDMGTAMKLLTEQALPKTSSGSGVYGDADTEMLQCILEFFLDMADGGELHTLAFFWPQLCCLHLRMLPPQTAADLARVELFEDFLLTIASRYSIHLAISMIWSHMADLEDSMSSSLAPSTSPASPTSAVSGHGNSTCSSTCKRRRFAVVRFMCELESLLFDLEWGWGGGSVTLGQMLKPSAHQIQLLRDTMMVLQEFRRLSPNRLSRSARRNRILKSYQSSPQYDGADELSTLPVLPPEQQAIEALRVAKNADYLSSHLVFTRRLCDIAERLFAMPVESRSNALQRDLSRLNASGTMGGDPLNKVRDRLSRVVRVPTTEGHVFRSKERTPVLLLMELVTETDEESMMLEPKAEESKSSDVNGDTSAPVKEITVASEGGKEAFAEGEQDEANTTPEENPQDDPGSAIENDEQIKSDKNKLVDGEGKADEETSDINPSTHDDDEGGTNREASSSNLDEDEPVGELQPRTKKVFVSSNRQRLRLESDGGDSANLEGSLDVPDDSARHALRRFESPKAGDPGSCPTTPNKRTVEALVTNVVAKQLQLPVLIAQSKEVLEQTEREENEALASIVGENDEVDNNDRGEDTGDAQVDDADGGDEENAFASESADTDDLVVSRKMSALAMSATENGESAGPMAKTGDTRREVLNSIMMKGMKGSNTIAAGAAKGFQLNLQDLERRRAVELMLTGEERQRLSMDTKDAPDSNVEKTRRELLSLGISMETLEEDNAGEKPTEDDEAMEAVRLLLIQYGVAQGTLTADAAAKALAPRPSLNQLNSPSQKGKSKKSDPRDFPQIDAGDVDTRLAGCGALPPAVLQALTLWKGGMVTNGELLELVKKDLVYVQHSIALEDSKDKLIEDSVFWGRFAFGERWAEKVSRINATSVEAAQPGWDLLGVIVKANDDLRQEAFVMQLIELCGEAFQEAGLELWLHPYRILSTGRTTGIIEMVRNAMSFDALKKRPGYGKGGLREHLQRMTEFTADPEESFKTAQRNFVRSLAAYSLLSYLFLFKDRHNGNILLDTAGHVIHIDFGFVFGIAPGGSFSLELSAPFKLTEEMIEVMDGLRSSLFSEFVTLFCCGFLALQTHCDTFLTIVDITCKDSTFKCFEGKDSAEVVSKLRDRFRPDLNREESIAFALDVIKQATQSYGTKQYDYFQYISQGIAA